VIDILFAIDIALNFRTGYVDDAAVVCEPRTIAKHYCRTWLAYDIIACFPWEIIRRIAAYDADSQSAHLAALLGFAKIAKLSGLMRLARFWRYMRRFEAFVSLGQIGVLCFVMMLLVHWIACVWCAPRPT
jgi:hypothetical protein